MVAYLIPSHVWATALPAPRASWLAERNQGCRLQTLGGSAALSPALPPRDATLLEKDFEAITACLLGKRSHLAEWENSCPQ